MPERADFSPSGQDIFRGNLLERFMLRRIAQTALRLPEAFNTKGRGGTLRVSGESSSAAVLINLNEDIKDDPDEVVRFTDIAISRSTSDRARILDLGASTYENDEVGDRMGLEPAYRQFLLGAEDNDLSLFSVMRAVSLAANTVEWAATLDYYMKADPHTPGGSFPQTF
jgi:hypothetical protein